jgi:3-oxoacyl-[acyl-carrier protein] reductase
VSDRPRVVLVTGGNRGIGLATALAFAKQGDKVAITYRTSPPHEAVAHGLYPVPCDVTDPAKVERAFTDIEAELGPVEVLVSNAGITRDTLVLRMNDDDFTDVVDANLVGGFRVAKRALKGMMRARYGRIIYVSSIVGFAGQAGQANYAASKAGLLGLARSLAREYASRGITVNIVAPGPIATDMLDALPEAQRDAMAQAAPVGRLGTPDEVAAVIRFLASDDAAYVTGVVVPVDGGMAMGA